MHCDIALLHGAVSLLYRAVILPPGRIVNLGFAAIYAINCALSCHRIDILSGILPVGGTVLISRKLGHRC